jgi:CheY-like chemotaxis protein
MGGDATAQSLPADPAYPVVAVTARERQDHLAHAEAVGCVAVITKPFKIDVLLSTIAGVLAQSPSPCQRTVGMDLEA